MATLYKLSLNSFILKTLKEVQLKCEMCDLYSYANMLINTDMLAFRFWLKCISSLFKLTIIIKIRQKVHQLTVFDIAILSWFQAAHSSECIGFWTCTPNPIGRLKMSPKPTIPFILMASPLILLPLKLNPRFAADNPINVTSALKS